MEALFHYNRKHYMCTVQWWTSEIVAEMAPERAAYKKYRSED